MAKIKQYIETDNGTFVIEMPGDSFTKAEEYLAKGKFELIEFETSEKYNEFQKCYFEKRVTSEHTIVYIWPTVWGFYGNKDGYMIWIDNEYLKRNNISAKQYATDQIKNELK